MQLAPQIRGKLHILNASDDIEVRNIILFVTETFSWLNMSILFVISSRLLLCWLDF